MEGLKQVGHQDLAIIGLAKARGEKDERIFLPGRKNPVVLRANSPATHLVQRIRDEAHRFAITFHRKLRSKALMASQLDQVIDRASPSVFAKDRCEMIRADKYKLAQ